MLKDHPKGKIKKLWLGFLVLVFLLILWVNQTIRSTQTSYSIKKVEEEIKTEERRQSEIDIERNRFLSLDSIETEAKEKLGMDHPKEQDIILISLPPEKGK